MPSFVDQAQSALAETLEDLQTRAEIEECVSDMIADVELSVHLEERLEHRQTVRRLRRQLQEQLAALEETNALRQRSVKDQAVLADRLVAELWCLSKQLGELQEIKLQHEDLMLQYDEVVARLMQAEDALQEVREGRTTRDGNNEEEEEEEKPQKVQKTQFEVSKTEKDDASESEKETSVKKEEKQQQSEQAELDAKPAAVDEIVPKAETTDVAELPSEAKAEASEEPSVTKDHLAEEQSTAADSPEPAVVALEGDNDAPCLTTFDTEILMNIFAFLDALDILNTAQVNVSMYNRVDALFGLGGGGHEEEDAEPPDADSSTMATTKTTKPAPAPAAAPASTTVAATAETPTATVVELPEKSGPTQMPAVSTTSSTDSGARGLFSQFLPPRRQGSAPSSPGRNLHKRTGSSASDGGFQPMNAAMANSMASKLSDAELNAIILMTERLKQKENVAAKLTKENEDLVAKLDGVESVKQFLIAKVRDMETSLSSSVENEVKVAQQIASDQEVIAFLDGRVQELERQVAQLTREKAASESELQKVRQQADEKATVMGDMLQFEREKLRDSEREWKATKKLLVREVKSCRAQIVALQAERDGYREQNETLRKAVHATSNGNLSHRDRAFT
jgi:hypothetical protein